VESNCHTSSNKIGSKDGKEHLKFSLCSFSSTKTLSLRASVTKMKTLPGGEGAIGGDDFIREVHTAFEGATSPALAVRIVAWATEEQGSLMMLPPTWRVNYHGFITARLIGSSTLVDLCASCG
jgi:transcriptional regulator of acetoin/glycerol metabolism